MDEQGINEIILMAIKIVALESRNAELVQENENLKVDVKGLNIQIGELKSELTTVRSQNR